MGGWFSITSLIGMAIAGAFTVVACRSLERGLVLYAVLGALPFFQVGAFSGNEMVQGIPLAEVLATALFGAWVLQNHRYPLGRLRSFERWLLLLLPASVLSLASGLAWLDHDVPQQNVKMSVSIGQILLFGWPMAVYFVTSRIVERAPGIERWFAYVYWLAVPQVLALTVSAARPYVSWSIYFGLIAAPLAFARATYEADWRKAVGLWLFGLPPLLEGLWSGKAFLYGYVLIAAVTIAAMRARRMLGLALPLLGLVATLIMMVPEGTPLPGPLEGLLEEERSQQSWGGDTGRGQLMADALNIWTRYPVLGVGPANSYPYMLRYSLLGTPHSQYADLILECGVIGLGIVFVFIGGVLVQGLAALKRPVTPERDMFLVAWVGSFFALSVLSITGDYMLHSIRNGGIEMFSGFYIHWVFMGTAMGVIRREDAVTAASMKSLPLAWRPRTATALMGGGAR